jgi:hypothetical protein
VGGTVGAGVVVDVVVLGSTDGSKKFSSSTDAPVSLNSGGGGGGWIILGFLHIQL